MGKLAWFGLVCFGLFCLNKIKKKFGILKINNNIFFVSEKQKLRIYKIINI